MTKKSDDSSIQEKLTQLDELVAWFESDEFQLEEASKKLQEAKALTAEIEHSLEKIENEITIVKQSFASDND
jgi:exodeoxyribonuclease VII small subunit